MAYGERQNEMRKYLEEQGVVFSDGEKYRPMISSCLGAVGATFLDMIDTISDIYIYNRWEQKDATLKTYDAVFWFHDTSDHVVLFAIGISTDAAEFGEAYTILCLLHELAHLEMMLEGKDDSDNPHNATFHRILDGLIEKFNRETGRAIENDYYGLEETERADGAGYSLIQNSTHDRKK